MKLVHMNENYYIKIEILKGVFKMAGLWLLSRTTSNNNYKKISTDLIMPQWVAGDSMVKPEYIVGFYRSVYGMDIGICYEGSTFQLFYSAAANTCSPQWETERVHLRNVKPEDRITMIAQIESTRIALRVYKSGTLQGEMFAPLTSAAKTAFVGSGATITRELTIGSNESGIVNPRNVYSYNASFPSGTITNINGTTSNYTSVAPISRNMVVDAGAVDLSIVKFKQVDTSKDLASIDLNRK